MALLLGFLGLAGFALGGEVPDHSGPMNTKCQACCACVHYHKLKGALPAPPSKSQYWKHTWLYNHGGEDFASQCHVEACADKRQPVSPTGKPGRYCWASDKRWVAKHWDDKNMAWRKSKSWNSNCGELIDPYICNTRKSCLFTPPTPAPTWAPTPPPSPYPTHAPSPTTAAPLRDEHPFCVTLAAAGDCANNRKWMARSCAKTCHAPPTPAPLTDKHSFCPTLAASGDCTSNRAWMLERCALSCDPQHGHELKDISGLCRTLGSACGKTKWMRKNCRATCHRLRRASKRLARLHAAKQRRAAAPTDTHSFCPTLAATGDCASNRAWMLAKCALSCLHAAKQRGAAAGGAAVANPAPLRAPTTAPAPAPTPAPSPAPTTAPTSPPTPAPTPRGPLKDLHAFCPSLKLTGHCASNRAWMQVNCARSCDYFARKGGAAPARAAAAAAAAAAAVPPQSAAPDKHGFCPLLARKGQCSTNRHYMLSNCPKSCTRMGVTAQGTR